MSTPRGPWDEPPRRRSRDPLPPELDPRGRRNAPPPGRRPPPDPRRGPARPAYGNEWGDRAGWDRDDRPDYGPPARSGGGPGGRPPVRPGPFDEGPRRRGRHPVVAGLRVAGVVLSVLVLVASGLMWFLYRDFTGKVDRVNAIGATADDVDGKDQNILLVGSDDRSNATPEELKELSTTKVTSSSTDTMILVHIPADGRRATAVSFPRDSWVEIPGHGQHKLNSAYAQGAFTEGGTPDKGRQLLVQTISELSGLHVDHYVEVNLLGFYRVTKAIGGVEVCLNKAQKEKDSGIDLPAGKSTIEGKQALSFVRQRKNLPRGDLDRIARQQYFIGATFRQITSLGVLGNPIKLKRLLDAVGTSLKMDPDLDPLQLARQVRGLAAGNLEFKTIPTAGTGNRGGQSVVLLDEEKLPAFFKTLRDGPAPAKPPAKTVPRDQVSVAVFNGSGRSGLASTAATGLKTAGFTVASTGNADRSDYPRTEIRYQADREGQARTLAAVIPNATLVERDNVGDSVQLVLGRDFTGVRTSSGPAKSSAAPQPTTAGTDRTAADISCIN